MAVHNTGDYGAAAHIHHFRVRSDVGAVLPSGADGNDFPVLDGDTAALQDGKVIFSGLDLVNGKGHSVDFTVFDHQVGVGGPGFDVFHRVTSIFYNTSACVPAWIVGKGLSEKSIPLRRTHSSYHM